MRAVILAAGRGGRLRGIVGDRPKCLARVGDCTLIERQIRVLRQLGLGPIAVVAGFHAPEVRRACGSEVHIVCNTRHAATNSLYAHSGWRDICWRMDSWCSTATCYSIRGCWPTS